MNKVQQTAGKVFTPEFLILMQSIPPQEVDYKSVSEFIKNMDKHVYKKRLSDCLIALSFYLTSLLIDNEEAFDESFNQIRKFDTEDKTESYIQ